MKDNIFNYRLFKLARKYLLSISLICLILISSTATAFAADLANRVAQFPQWNSKPAIKLAKGDLEYPEWMMGVRLV